VNILLPALNGCLPVNRSIEQSLFTRLSAVFASRASTHSTGMGKVVYCCSKSFATVAMVGFKETRYRSAYRFQDIGRSSVRGVES